MCSNGPYAAKPVLCLLARFFDVGMQKCFYHTLIGLARTQVRDKGNKQKESREQQKEANCKMKFAVIQKIQFEIE